MEQQEKDKNDKNKRWGARGGGRGDKIVKIDKTSKRNCYAELGFLQSLGQEQFLFLFTNEIPLCSA